MTCDSSEVVGSTIATEYPIAYVKGGANTPVYPAITEETKVRYEEYRQEAKQYKSIFLCGRLAEFRYYNIDDCIFCTLTVSKKIQRALQYADLAKQLAASVIQTEVTGIINCCTGNPVNLTDRGEKFIREHGYSIRLEYRAYPGRLYDSPGVWGAMQRLRGA